MGFVKVVKNKAYYKRFQVKCRRRREGKTDFYARRRLIHQDKNKYDTKKYRLVVRRTNRRIICQIIYATIQGDRVLAQADSFELKRFGLEAGLTNYAASYCTGLLVARRLLADLGMADMYKGVENVDGELFDIYEKGFEHDRRPFKAVLDVGLVRTTTGNRVFGALKGAVDGGLFVKHNTKRFPGYHIEKQAAATSKRGKVLEKAKNTGSFNAKEHRDHIFGLHVQTYMDLLKKEKNDRFKKQFVGWEKCMKAQKVNNLEALYKKVHAEIRKAPQRVKAQRKHAAVRKQIKKEKGTLVQANHAGKKWLRSFKLTREQRKQRVVEKIQKALSRS